MLKPQASRSSTGLAVWVAEQPSGGVYLGGDLWEGCTAPSSLWRAVRFANISRKAETQVKVDRVFTEERSESDHPGENEKRTPHTLDRRQEAGKLQANCKPGRFRYVSARHKAEQKMLCMFLSIVYSFIQQIFTKCFLYGWHHLY